jgi:hypothetical protein
MIIVTIRACGTPILLRFFPSCAHIHFIINHKKQVFVQPLTVLFSNCIFAFQA